MSNRASVALLRGRKKQTLAFFTAAKPDLAVEEYKLEVCVLNAHHTQREVLLTLSKRENANKATDFLTAHFDLELESYNPRF